MAGKTMVISLPSDVVKRYGLRKSQELDVEEHDGKVIISIANHLCKEPCELNIKENLIQEQLEYLYTQGYDEVKVYYENKSILKKIIQNINKNFIGFQVLESNSKYGIIKSIAKEDETKLQSLIRRQFLILLSFLEDGDEDSVEILIKLANVCKRMLHKKSYTLNKALHLYSLITGIEEISRIKCKNGKLAKELIEQIYNLYYKFDELELIKIKDRIEKELTVTKNDGNTALFFYNIQKMLNVIAVENVGF